jgi:hypothetical protein
VTDFGTNKTPGPDGFIAEFFKKSWNILKEDIKGVFNDFFKNGIINASVNETYICLIPKIGAKSAGDFRPISLTTYLYKIITRVLSERLKKVLPSTITEYQSAFVENRQILDASLIANKLIEEWNQRKKKGVVIKLDIEKAFDRVDWDLLDEILRAKGFGQLWRKWIKGCISSVSYSIIINGKPRGKIIASRDLRQGEPLSPFFIHHCVTASVECFSWLNAQDSLKIFSWEKICNPYSSLTCNLQTIPYCFTPLMKCI